MTSDEAGKAAKRAKVSQLEFPNNTLEAALRIPKAIWDQFAGKSAAPHDIAMAMDLSPTSGTWRNLCGSAIAYGLTEGGYNADEIKLTKLGRRAIASEEEGDDIRARAEAVVRPRLLKMFFERYDRSKFPKDDIAGNVLVGLGLPKERATQAVDILKSNGRFAAIIRDTKTGPFVAMNGAVAGAKQMGEEPPEPVRGIQPSQTDASALVDDDASEARDGGAASKMSPVLPSGPRQLFVAHGKNRKPLEDLKKILDQFKIPYKVALDEPHAGRPISKKVADLMRTCSAGIFIFTMDEKFLKEDGSEVWRPSENVVYELGAGNILWDNKIIIVKESGVDFPSDFRDIGYITFNAGEIANKALDLLKELVALGLVKVQAA